jgi:hypothetical protein
MTERKQFEAWYSGRYGEKAFLLHLTGQYKDWPIECMWKGWHSRATIAQPAPPINNFCPRCGKRKAADLLHTCTPPDTVPAIHAQEPIKLDFPMMMRRMWSASDVQDWLDALPEMYSAPPDAQAIRDQANEMRIMLLVQLHNLVDMAERYSKRIEMIDPDESRYAAAAAKHALRLSTQYNYNGPIRAMISKPTGSGE